MVTRQGGWDEADERGDPVEGVAWERRRDDDEQAGERREVEWATTSWLALVAGSLDRPARVTTVTGGQVAGLVSDCGDGWCQVDTASQSVVVLLQAVVSVRADLRVAPRQAVERKVGSILRRWVHTRQSVSVELRTGADVAGRLSHVLSDAIVVAEAVGAENRPTPGLVTIPLSAVVCVRGPKLGAQL